MGSYFAAEPVTDKSCRTIGHRLSFSDADGFEAAVNRKGTEALAGDGRVFFRLTREIADMGLPRFMRGERAVAELTVKLLESGDIRPLIARLRRAGCKLAAPDILGEPKYFGILDSVDIISVDMRSAGNEGIERAARMARSFKKEIFAYHVSSPEAYDRANFMGSSTFSGSFASVKTASPCPAAGNMDSFFKLMSILGEPSPDTEKAAAVISGDAAMQENLIKLANSPRYMKSVPVKSTEEAVKRLKAEGLRQWAYLLSFRAEGNGAYERIAFKGLARAALCAELSEFADETTLSPTDAYMMGILSLSGRLFRISVKEAVQRANAPAHIAEALSGDESGGGKLFSLVRAYENASWDTVDSLADYLGIPQEIIAGKYMGIHKNLKTALSGLQG